MSQGFFITAQVVATQISLKFHTKPWSFRILFDDLRIFFSNGLVKNHPTRDAPDVSFQVYPLQFEEKRPEPTKDCQTLVFRMKNVPRFFFGRKLAQETIEVVQELRFGHL